MASRSFRKIEAPQHGVKILNGTILIPSTSVAGGPISFQTSGYGQSVGFRSGSASAVAGIYTASLGDSSDPADPAGGPTRNDKYADILSVIFQTRPNVSASLYAPPIATVRLIQDRVADLGQIMFCTSEVSASATAGTMTETVGRPSRDTLVDVTLFVKNSNVR